MLFFKQQAIRICLFTWLIAGAGNLRAADTEGPEAGCNGKITIERITTTSLALSWCKATDSVTTHQKMKYSYTYAEGFDQQAFPAANTKTATGITDTTITGLKPATKYTVWVYATNEQGLSNTDTLKYQPINIETLAIEHDKPVPGNRGKLKIDSVSPYGFTISWAKATDGNGTPQRDLEYQVWYRLPWYVWEFGERSPRLRDTTTWTTDTALIPGKLYYVSVVVYDANGNIGEYLVADVQLPVVDPINPAPGCDSTVTIQKLRDTSVIVNWCPATDNLTQQDSIVYYAELRSRGIVVRGGIPYTPGIDSYTVGELKPGTTYTLRLIAIDKENNRSSYKPLTFTTPTEPPKELITELKLNHSVVSVDGDIDSLQLQASFFPTDATDTTVVWNSSDTAVATVDSTGLVVILRKGNATITATANDGGGAKADCAFNIITTVSADAIESRRIWTAENGLHLELPTAETVSIYTISGQLIRRIALPAGHHIVPMPTGNGVYIVTGNRWTQKVSI